MKLLDKLKGLPITTERVFFSVVILFLLISLLHTCNDARKALGIYDTTLKGVSQKRLSDGTTIYKMSQNIKSLEEAIRDRDIDIEKLKSLGIKNPTSVIKTDIEVNSTIKDIESDSEVSTVEDSSGAKMHFLSLPANFNKEDRYLSFKSTVDTNGVMNVDYVRQLGQLTHTFGSEPRPGFFNRLLGKKDPVVILSIDNPDIQVKGLQNIVVKEEKKFYQTTLFMIGAGVLIGSGAVMVLSN